jgi:hypothetical protein
MIMIYYETYESKYIFITKIQILFRLHVVQFGTTFDMQVEIHLICRK